MTVADYVHLDAIPAPGDIIYTQMDKSDPIELLSYDIDKKYWMAKWAHLTGPLTLPVLMECYIEAEVTLAPQAEKRDAEGECAWCGHDNTGTGHYSTCDKYIWSIYARG